MVSTLYTSIPVSLILEVINRKLTENIKQTGTEHFLENYCFIPKDKIIFLLELVLNKCVFFFFQEKFCQHLLGAAVSSPASPVIAKIYCPRSSMFHTYPLVKRYVDDIISIVKQEQEDTLFNHLNSVHTHIKLKWKLHAMMVASHSWIPNVLPI